MNRATSATSLVLLMLAGCAPIDRDFGAQARDPRYVTVNVEHRLISLPEGYATLYEKNGAIRWVFGSNPDEYEFPEDGIQFDRHPPPPPPEMGCRSQPDPDAVFKNCRSRDFGQGFQCNKTGPHTADACFKYDIKLVPKDGSAPIKLDPWAKLK